MSESSLFVITVLPSSVYTYFKLEVEKMKYAKPCFKSSKKLNELNGFVPFYS